MQSPNGDGLCCMHVESAVPHASDISELLNVISFNMITNCQLRGYTSMRVE